MNLFFNSAASDPASALVRSQTNNQPALKPTFVLGDNPELNIYVTDGSGGYDPASGDATVTPSLGIGTPGAGPSGGTFWLGVSTATSGSLTTSKRYQIETYVAGDDFANLGAAENATGVVFTSSGTTPTDWTNGSTVVEITGEISYAASAATLEAALEATEAVVGVTVTKASAAPNFVVEWDSVGAVALLVGGPSSLTPASAVVTSELQAGSASAVERQIVRLTRQPYALQTVWSTITNGWSARLQCNTRGLLDFLGSSVSAFSTLELELTDSSSNVRTVGQIDCMIRNEAIDEASTIPTPFPNIGSYLTATQVNQNFVQNRFQVTALDGGGTALDGIPTGTTALPTVPTDALVAIELGGDIFFYELVAGTDAESLPDVVRPDDFATTTNERVWLLRAVPSAIAAHASTHEDGGSDEINVAGLSGLLADGQTALAHASTHEDGGSDEISVAGLSGLLADGQTPLTHASTHASAGSDPLTLAQSQVTGLTSALAAKLPLAGGTMTGQLNFSGTTHAGLKLLSLTTVQRDALTPANGMLIYNTTTATVQKYEAGAWVNSGTPAAHASTHQNGGADEISVAGLSGLLADGQTPIAHIASHAPGGSDALPWTTIHGRGTTGAKPAAAAGNAGYLYFDTTLAKLQRSTGSAWEDVAEPGAVTSYSLTATTTDATQTELLTAASARLTLPDSTAWGFTALFTGRYNGDGDPGFAVWTARDSSRLWYGIASSSDGTKLVATVNGGQIYTSTDSGVTWTARDSSRTWASIASSSDGSKLAAGVTGGQIYTSTDSGVTWTARATLLQWRAVASSSDGTKLVAVASGDQIYTSTDSGVTWTARDAVRSWRGAASSSDGVKLAATVISGQIYTSSDSGVTWTARDSVRGWFEVASSSDGTKLVATVDSGQIYTSTDSGVTWTARDSSRAWYGIASSSDGTKLAAGVDGGQIYTSTDSGVTWTARASNRAWFGIASSSDGTKLVAGVTDGQIYTSTSDPIPAVSETCEFKGHAVRDSGAASMAISALQENPIGTNTAGRFVCQADTTNGALQFLATGAASETWKWGVSIQTVEVTP